MTTRDEIEDIAGRCGARRGDRKLEERAKDLREQLGAAKLGELTQVLTPGGELVVLWKPTSASRVWEELPIMPIEARSPVDAHPSALRAADDAAIKTVADVLEAKYRLDQLGKHYLRGLPEEPDVLHDGIDLAIRTWRDALSISLRAQRALLNTARRGIGTRPARPTPLARISGPIRMEWRGEAWQGRFSIRNDRGTALMAELHGTVATLASATIGFTPARLSLKSGETAVVNVKLVADANATGSHVLAWAPAVPFGTVDLVLV